MATLTIRLSDEKHERLRQLAERRKISMNKLLDELSTIALAEFDAETPTARGSRHPAPADSAPLEFPIEDVQQPQSFFPGTESTRGICNSRARWDDCSFAKIQCG